MRMSRYPVLALIVLAALARLVRGDDPAPPPAPAAPVGRIVIYRATPEGEEARPFRLYFLVEVPYAPPGVAPAPPPVVPVPPPVPAPPPPPAPPDPDAAELRSAAAAYGGTVPYRRELAAALNALAAEVVDGGYGTISEVVAEVGRRRRPLGAAPPAALGARLGGALDRVARAGCDPDGTIRNRATVARALALASEALEVPLGD